jgi:hypothetical protein
MPSGPASRILEARLFTAVCSDEPLRCHRFEPNGEGISRLADISGDRPKRQKLKRDPIGVRALSLTSGVHALTPHRYRRSTDGCGMRRIRKQSGYEQDSI